MDKLDDKIVEHYLSGKHSIKTIANASGKSPTYITNLLKNKGIYLIDDEVCKPITIKYPPIDGKKYIAICKLTGKEFHRFKNTTTITAHLKSIYPNYISDNHTVRKNIQYKTGDYWFIKYFDIKLIDDVISEVKKCKYCEWETEDINNVSGAYESHLKIKHNKELSEYINEYPEDLNYFTIYKKQLDKITLLNNQIEGVDYVICKICNRKLGYITQKHLSNHNISKQDYIKRYDNNLYSKSFIDKTTKNLKEIATVNIKKTFKSKAEIEIGDWLTKLGLNIRKGDKSLLKGIELDIYIPDLKIAIEYNGNKYHSEIYGKKDYKYHLNKTNICKSNNVRLIHIFGDEWQLKNEIVRNKLSHILNLNGDKERIFARKCIIKGINSKEKNIFLNQYHIQGECKSTINLGAFNNDTLVAVMTFDSNRNISKYNKNTNEIELNRFATHSNYIVVGIASKFINYFIKKYNYKEIISFADIRWTDTDNNLYLKLGFTLDAILKPDYTYFNSNLNVESRLKRYHKANFSKKQLKVKHPEIYDINKTEWEMMQILKYDRIWDCGKIKYRYYIIKKGS